MCNSILFQQCSEKNKSELVVETVGKLTTIKEANRNWNLYHFYDDNVEASIDVRFEPPNQEELYWRIKLPLKGFFPENPDFQQNEVLIQNINDFCKETGGNFLKGKYILWTFLGHERPDFLEDVEDYLYKF